MPIRITTWLCEKCSSSHRTYDAAERCETRHIVDNATAGLGAEIEKILGNYAKKKESSQ